VAVVSAALVVFALGYLTEVALIRPLRDREEFGIPSMVVTLGLAFFLENAFIVWIGSQRESFPRFTSVVWDIGGITLSAQRVLIFVISLVALGLLFYVIARTKLGLGIRAVSQDNDTALLMGVRPNRIYAITFGISAALAGLAGVLLAPLLPSSISWVVPVPPLVRCRDGRWAQGAFGVHCCRRWGLRSYGASVLFGSPVRWRWSSSSEL